MKAVEVEDWPSRRAFDEIRDALIAEGKKFDETSIKEVSYEQLYLCCIGNAGVAACSPKLIQVEKKARRERFMSMELDEFSACEPFLRAQGMYEDVKYAIAMQAAPSWETLTDRQRVWAVLNCLYNHPDDPKQRMEKAIDILYSSVTLPTDVSRHYIQKLRGLIGVYPSRINTDLFRSEIADVAENIRLFLPEEELSLCRKEEIRDFQCTSDCFRMM
jgi:hypothetical protein